jgi:pSer/pThr/pTyr-binding forkhead associated (FHA) protein
MSHCRSCGLEIEPVEGVCPECGARTEGETESFQAVIVEERSASPVDRGATQPMLVVEKGHEVGERFEIRGPSLTLGRDPASDVFLNDVTVSRQHAVIETIDSEITIRDVGSLNGTYVNGVRVDEARLQHGDSVQVGRFQMVFLAGSAD